MTIEAKKRLAQAGYSASKRCGNCEHFAFSEKSKVPNCNKFATPVSSDRVCNFHKKFEKVAA